MTALQSSLLAALATLFGGALVLTARKWSTANRALLLAFTAGVLTGLSFLSILPEAFERNEAAPFAVVVGFLVMYLLERYVLPHDVHHERELELGGLTVMAWFGLLIHSLVDGLAIASAAATPAGLLTPVTLGVVLHELPEGLVAAALLLAMGYSAPRILALTALVAFATPLGTLLSTVVLAELPIDLESTSYLLTAFAGGTFVYVGVADMLHQAHEGKHEGSGVTVAFLLGIGLFVILRLFGHGHGH